MFNIFKRKAKQFPNQDPILVSRNSVVFDEVNYSHCSYLVITSDNNHSYFQLLSDANNYVNYILKNPII